MSYSHIFQELPVSPTVIIQETSTVACRCLPIYTRTLCVWLKDDDGDNEQGKFYVTKFKSLFLSLVKTCHFPLGCTKIPEKIHINMADYILRVFYLYTLY